MGAHQPRRQARTTPIFELDRLVIRSQLHTCPVLRVQLQRQHAIANKILLTPQNERTSTCQNTRNHLCHRWSTRATGHSPEPLYWFVDAHRQTRWKQDQLSLWLRAVFNLLDSKGNYSATSNNTKLVHWPLMGGLLHLVQRGGAWAGCGPAQSPPRCTKCNSPPINGQCTTLYSHKLVWRLQG